MDLSDPHQENYTSTYVTWITLTSDKVTKVDSSGEVKFTWLSRLLPYKVNFSYISGLK